MELLKLCYQLFNNKNNNNNDDICLLIQLDEYAVRFLDTVVTDDNNFNKS